MSMTVHHLMAFNPHYFRPHPLVNSKPQRPDEQSQTFQDVLNEKLKAFSEMKK